jgi:hypothetical protein
MLPEGCLSMGVTYKTPTGEEAPLVSSATSDANTGIDSQKAMPLDAKL